LTKIDDKISLAEHKLEEIKTKFEGDKDNLTSLVRQRAKLETEAVFDNKQDGKRIIEIDRQRDKLRSQIEIYPDLIKEMESRVEASKKEKEEGILRENLAKQKKAAHEVERLSGELGTLLTRANEANIELQKCRSMYLKLHELTGQDLITKPTTPGSQGSLRILSGIISAELEGHPRLNPRFPPPGPAI